MISIICAILGKKEKKGRKEGRKEGGKSVQTQTQRTHWWLTEVGIGVGELGEGSQSKGTNFSYKINSSWGCNV